MSTLVGMRPVLPLTVGLLLLAACAPAMVTKGAAPSPLRAAFSDQGVAFVAGGRACVARAPSYRTVCPRLAGAVDVAWNGGDAWAAVPSLGVAVTLDRAARSVNVGRVVALSATRAYREDGSAVGYSGEPRAGVTGGPTQALTGGDGVDYVMVAGALVTVPGGARVQGPAGAYIVYTPTGARLSAVPAVDSPVGTYRLTGGRLERVDAAGRVVAAVPHPEGCVGVVGADVVTVAETGQVQVYTQTLSAQLH
jgi:hypothetical protein